MTPVLKRPPLTEDDSPTTKNQLGWLRPTIVIVSIALLVVILLRRLTPTQVEPQTIVSQNYDNSVSTFNNVTYTGSSIYIPAKLPIATVEVQNLDEDEYLKKLSEIFSLSADNNPDFSTGMVATYSNKQYILYKSPENDDYHLNSTVEYSTAKVNQDQALLAAQKVVDSLYPDSNLKPLLANIENYEYGNLEPSPINKEDAVLIKIPFSNFIDQYPLYDGQNLDPVITVWVDGDTIIRKLIAQPSYFKSNVTKNYDTLTYTQALSNINDDKASIASALFLQPGIASYDAIAKGTLVQAKIEYRLDATTGVAYPYYHFKGSLTNAANQTFEATVLTPAIQTNFSQ